MKSLTRILPAILLVGVLVLGLGRYGLTQDHALYVAFSLLVPAAALVLWGSPRYDTRLRIAMSVIGAYLLIQVVFQPTDEARGYTVAALGWMSLLIAFRLASRGSAGRRLFLFLIGLCLVEALFGLAQALGGMDRIFAYDRKLGSIATGTFINRNHFAGFANMGLGLTLGWLYTGFADRRKRREHRSETLAWSWLVLMVCGLIGLAVLLSRSRGGTVSMVGMLGFAFVLLMFRRRRRGSVGALPAGMIAVLLVTIVAFGALANVGGLVDRFASEDSLTRPQVYLDTLRMIADHPVAGVGPGMYVWRFRPYQTSSVSLWFNHAHNDYLETAAEWGILLASLFWAFVFLRLYRLARLFLIAEEPWRQGLSFGCAAALAAILLHSLVDFNLHIPANLMVFATVLGIGWAAECEHRNLPTAPVLPGPGSGS